MGQYDRQDHFKTHHATSIDFENQKPFHWSDRRETKKITVMLKNMEAAESNDMVYYENSLMRTTNHHHLHMTCQWSNHFATPSSLRVEVEQQRKMSQVMRRSSVNSNEQEVHFNLLLAMIEISIVDHRRTEILFLRITECL